MIHSGKEEDRFLSMVGYEVTWNFSNPFGDTDAAIRNADRVVAFLGINQVTEDWCEVARGTTIWEPVMKVRWAKTLM